MPATEFDRATAVVAIEDAPGAWGVFRSTTAPDGFFEEDGKLWTRDGVLLAHSRQLALLNPPGRTAG